MKSIIKKTLFMCGLCSVALSASADSAPQTKLRKPKSKLTTTHVLMVVHVDNTRETYNANGLAQQVELSPAVDHRWSCILLAVKKMKGLEGSIVTCSPRHEDGTDDSKAPSVMFAVRCATDRSSADFTQGALVPSPDELVLDRLFVGCETNDSSAVQPDDE